MRQFFQSLAKRCWILAGLPAVVFGCRSDNGAGPAEPLGKEVVPIMKRALLIAVAVLALVAASAQAEQITLGSLSGTGHISAPVTVGIGNSNFSFDASVTALGGVWGPAECLLSMCVPGTTINLDARFSGKDFIGDAVYNGQRYTRVGALNGSSWMDARWSGSLTIPSEFAGGTLTAPFLFEGSFGRLEGTVPLFGAGTIYADLFLRPTGTFHLSSIEYRFEDPATRTLNPEPSTWLLMSTGAAWLVRVRHRRRLRGPGLATSD